MKPNDFKTVAQMRAEETPPQWRCPICKAAWWPLPELWDHMREAHDWRPEDERGHAHRAGVR